jgi:hypothetical protein
MSAFHNAHGFTIAPQQQKSVKAPTYDVATRIRHCQTLFHPIAQRSSLYNFRTRCEMVPKESADQVDEDEDGEYDASSNPYADPNYPELEFVNYDDPEYAIDRSLSSTEATIEDEALLEQMREERRIANDEYQYNSYWHTVWNAGLSTYHGEWTVYYSSNFFPQLDDDDDVEDISASSSNVDTPSKLPRLIQSSDAPLTMLSRAILQNTTTSDRNVLSYDSYITHVEDLEQGMGDIDLAMAGGADELEQNVVSQTYWPSKLSQSDFRGHQGIMICGK